MDIARLLTHDDSASDVDGQSDGERTRAGSAPSPRSVLSAVARRAPRERRRKLHVQELRAQVQAYECVLANLPLVLRGGSDEPSSEIENEGGDADSQRMREFLRRTALLARQSEQELAKRAEWLRLLRHRHVSTMGLRQLMAGLVVDDWHWMCERWRTLTREHYSPFTEARCCELVQETLKAIASYEFPNDTKASGRSFCGWHGSHVLDGDRRYVHFYTHKTLRDTDIDRFVDHAWAIYMDGRFQEYNIGRTGKFFTQILQRILPDIVIIQTVERYPSLPKMTHTLALAFRVKTDTGYLISYRSVPSPELQRMMQSEGLSMSGNFFWTKMDTDPRDPTTSQLIVAGYLGSDEPEYAERWGADVVLSVVRTEAKVTGTPILLVPSTDE